MTARKPKTRAQLAGVSAAALARKARRFFDQTEARLQQLAYEWAEIYGGAETAANDFGRALEQFEEEMKGAIEYIKEPPEES